MAKRLKWSKTFRRELKAILEFWDENNQSSAYSSTLFKKITNTLNLLSESHYLGKPTIKLNVRSTVIDHFLIFYEITEEEIVILSIFDARRNPKSKKVK